MTYAKLKCLKYNCLIIELWLNKWLMFNVIARYRKQNLEPTVGKRISLGSFKNVTSKMCLQVIYI